jgi:hypothetical protein
MLNKRFASTLFIAAQKALFAIPGHPVLLSIAAAAMRTFYRR